MGNNWLDDNAAEKESGVIADYFPSQLNMSKKYDSVAKKGTSHSGMN